MKLHVSLLCIIVILFSLNVYLCETKSIEEYLRYSKFYSHAKKPSKTYLPYLKKSKALTNGKEVDTKLRVLAIDGGGVRGILPAQLLLTLETKIKNLTNNPNAVIGDYVDVVAGTSTGGLMSIAILAGYNATTISKIYQNAGPIIFGNKTHNGKGAGINQALYSPSGFISVLKAGFGEDKLSLFSNHSHAIVSFNLELYESGTMTRNSIKETGDFYVWQAGRATGSPPVLLPTVFVQTDTGKNITFCDGGVMADNPVIVALTVAEQDYGIEFDPANTAVLSLGCGHVAPYIHGTNNWGVTQWLKQGDIIDQLFESPENDAVSEVSRIFHKAGTPEQFSRMEFKKNSPHKFEGCDSCYLMSDSASNATKANIVLLEACGNELSKYYDSQLTRFAKYFTGLE